MVQELDLLKKYQKISVKELAETLRVSEMTVRRDLELLRKNHVLERSYGYATPTPGKAGEFQREGSHCQVCGLPDPPRGLGVSG